MRSRTIVAVAGVVFLVVMACGAYADEVSLVWHEQIDPTLEERVCGVAVPGVADYDWWYGCSPTSVGMVLGTYDRNGYGTDASYYANIAPAGVAETDLRGTGNPAADRAAAPIATSLIATQRHVDDYWGTDSPTPGADDSLCDFMETSQSPRSDGGTTFYYWTNGAAFDYTQAVSNSVDGLSGMYGIYEYMMYCGYPGSDIVNLYNQYIIEEGLTFGFTLAQYQAEIDAGRPVLIQVEGHTMVGWGYDGSTIYIDNTWTDGTQTMTWGGSYAGMAHYGVTVIELVPHNAGTVIPEPATFVLFAISAVGCGIARRRRKAA